MANETDKNLLGEVERAFDKSALMLNELLSEIVSVKEKYGSESSLFKKKNEQLNTLRDLHDKTLNYINTLREANSAMSTEFIGYELMRVQRETGIPISKIVQLAGGDPAQWQRVDQLDAVVNKVKVKLNIREESNGLECLIELLRGRV